MPDNLKFYRELYQIAMKQGNLYEMMEAFCASLVIRPFHDKTYDYIFNICKQEEQLYPQAIKAVRQVVAANSEYKPAFKALFDLACESHEYGLVLEEFRENLKLKPRDHDIHYYMRMLYYRSNEYEELIDVYDDLLILDAEVKEFYVWQSRTYEYLKNIEKAIQTLNKALQVFKYDDEIYAALVDVHIRAKKYEYALEFC